MLRELTQTETDARIAQYIEPSPGIPDRGEYRLKEEYTRVLPNRCYDWYTRGGGQWVEWRG